MKHRAASLRQHSYLYSYSTLKNIVTLKFRYGHSRSLEMAPWSRTSSSTIVSMATSCIVYETKRDIGGKSWFSYPLYTTAPWGKGCDYFRVVFFLHNWARWIMVQKYRWTRSTAVIERPRHASRHWIFRKVTHDHSRSVEIASFDRSHTSSCLRSVTTMALSCIISEIKRDIGRKSRFFIPLLHSEYRCNVSYIWNKKFSCRKETARCYLSLHMLLSHSRSLKIIRSDTVVANKICMYVCMYVCTYVCMYVCMLSRACVSPYQYSIETMSVYRTVSEIFSVKNGVILKPGVGVVQGHWKLRCSIGHIRLSIGPPCKCNTLYHFRVIWRWIISWPWNVGQRSLKIIKSVPFEILGAISYSPSIVSVAVSLTVYEIFNVEV